MFSSLSDPLPLPAQTLRGSSRSLNLQNRQARAHDFSFLESSARVRRFVELGLLVPVCGNSDYEVHQVSFPYARSESRLFIERLSKQYLQSCGERLVVTSLTRPLNRQPGNASSQSVHPTGMALDLRRSNVRACRIWLERVLLSLEGQGVLEATRESRPPHYHIALFPQPYVEYVDQLVAQGARESTVASSNRARYEVRRGDSLWGIARDLGTTVGAIRAANDLAGSRIYAGQVLEVPSPLDTALVSRHACSVVI